MITLYHAPQSRSSRIIWLLEELEAPYRIEIMPIKRGSGEGQPAPKSYRRIHPHLKVPAIEHDGQIVFESAAIALYLTDAFPANSIGPKVGDPLRAPYVTWLAYSGSVMEPAFTSKFMNWQIPAGAPGWAPFDDVLAYITRTLQKGPYFLGECFSAADIILGSLFVTFLGSPLLPSTNLFAGYTERLKARPAFQRAQARDNG